MNNMNKTNTTENLPSFLLTYTGAEDMTEFANLPATDISDAFYAWATEVRQMDDNEALNYAEKMTERVL